MKDLDKSARVANRAMPEQPEKDSGRPALTINSNADADADSQRCFKPTIKEIKVYTGDPTLTSHIAQNRTNKAIAGISTYHVNPPKVGIYFNKIQCPRSEEQRSKPKESIEMPIPFLTDPDSEKDPRMKDVDTTTSSH